MATRRTPSSMVTMDEAGDSKRRKDPENHLTRLVTTIIREGLFGSRTALRLVD